MPLLIPTESTTRAGELCNMWKKAGLPSCAVHFNTGDGDGICIRCNDVDIQALGGEQASNCCKWIE